MRGPRGAARGTGPRPERADAARDPGLQPERTRLAWRRTTLACTVATVLAVRSALHEGLCAAGAVAGALCLACWLGFLLVAHRRITTLTAPRPRTLAPGVAAVAALCTAALALCGVAAVV
ncbi:hypothetical protein GCM10018785_51150 [Streptomyces longispororuber]|uniref:DUF202 domain-containing protein n=1 Tax=Streptomyces longispororuber TaxID=68230 RepID=A0A918ZXM8_9ACTN|nr:DUF202 domain-containing protein [Streptomyces longispororuber]GHE76647.1 hypothetical protein GCM10018785_51150 [Streptomyces longispororuber]